MKVAYTFFNIANDSPSFKSPKFAKYVVFLPLFNTIRLSLLSAILSAPFFSSVSRNSFFISTTGICRLPSLLHLFLLSFSQLQFLLPHQNLYAFFYKQKLYRGMNLLLRHNSLY